MVKLSPSYSILVQSVVSFGVGFGCMKLSKSNACLLAIGGGTIGIVCVLNREYTQSGDRGKQ